MSDPNIAEKYYGKLKAQGEETIADFVWQQAETIKQLRRDRDDLANQVKALKAWSALTHAELLAEIQAEAIEKAVREVRQQIPADNEFGSIDACYTYKLIEYADQLRQQPRG